MRTLKKTLALVLVLAMALSLCVIGANAAFTDVTEDTEYSEAIQVLTGIGVINGMTSTTFVPDGTLTREQAAKIVCYMMLGPTNAELVSTATSQTFDDVAADRWSAGYIEYCANVGIIAGVGDNNFDPEGTLTTAAFTKMLLCAVGYKADVEGFTGASWALNVASLAVTAGIYDSDIAISAVNVTTRAEACQLAFKALTAKTVEYVGGSTMVVGGVTITTGATRSYVENDEDTGYLSADNDAYMQFCESHFSTLKLYSASSDVYGRPAHKWMKSTTTIGVFTDTPVMTFTTAFKPSTVATELANDGYTLPTSTDALEVVAELYTNGISEDLVTADVEAFKAATDSMGGNGLLVEFYANSDDEITTIVAVNTWMAAVTGYTKDTAATTTVDERTLSFMVNGHTVVANPDDTTGFDAVYDAYLEARADGDVCNVLLVPTNDGTANGTALCVAIPETVTGKVTRTTSSGVYTIAGNNYKLSYQSDVTPAINDSAMYYLDTYGYIIGAGEVTTDTTTYYGYLVDYAKQDYAAGGLLKDDTDAAELFKFVNSDGDTVTLSGAFDTDDDTGAVTDFVNIDEEALEPSQIVNEGELFAYTLDSDGDIATVTACDGSETGSYTITKGSAVFDGWYMTSKTVVFYVDEDDNVAAYTGYSNVITKDVTSYQYIEGSTDYTYAALVVDVATVSPTTTADYVFFASDDVSVETTADGTTYTYTDVYLDGVLGELVFEDEQTVAANELYSYSVTDGYATLIDSFGPWDEVVDLIESTYFVTDSMTYTYNIDSGTQYYEIEYSDDGTITVAPATGLPALSSYYDSYLYWADEDGDADDDTCGVVYFYVGDGMPS